MAGPNQRTKSMNDVLTSVTHMLEQFEKFATEEFGCDNIVYDHDLSYETGLKTFIEKSNYNNEQEKPDPLLIYNRTITEDSMFGLASRARNTTGTKRFGENVLKYSCAYSEYDLNFLYVCHDVRKQEAFEVTYNSNSGLSAKRELVVEMGDLGEFKYFLTPLPLTEITISGEGGVTYKAIGGIIRVRGFFFVFEGQSGIIKQIIATIYNGKGMADKKEENVLARIELEAVEEP